MKLQDISKLVNSLRQDITESSISDLEMARIIVRGTPEHLKKELFYLHAEKVVHDTKIEIKNLFIIALAKIVSLKKVPLEEREDFFKEMIETMHSLSYQERMEVFSNQLPYWDKTAPEWTKSPTKEVSTEEKAPTEEVRREETV